MGAAGIVAVDKKDAVHELVKTKGSRMVLSKRKAKERFSGLVEIGLQGAADDLEHEPEDVIAEGKIDEPAGDDLVELLPLFIQLLAIGYVCSPPEKISGQTGCRES